MDVDKIINDFEQKKDTMFTQKIESYVDKLEKLKEKIIDYDSKYDLKLDIKKLKENIEVFVYHCALYIKTYDSLSDEEQTSIFEDLKETYTYFVEFYNSIADTVNKIIDDRKKKKEYEEKIDQHASAAIIDYVVGFIGIVIGAIMLISGLYSGESLLGLTIFGGILAVVGIIFIVVGANNGSAASELRRRQYLESLDDKQFKIEQQILKEKSDAANASLLALIALGIWNK